MSADDSGHNGGSQFFAHLPRVIEHYHLFFQPSGNHTPGRLVQLVGLTHFRMVPRIYVGYSFNYVNEMSNTSLHGNGSTGQLDSRPSELQQEAPSDQPDAFCGSSGGVTGTEFQASSPEQGGQGQWATPTGTR